MQIADNPRGVGDPRISRSKQRCRDAALAQLFPLNAPANATATCASVSSSWTPPDVVGFHACSVSLSCTSYVVGAVTQYRINSKAVCESGDTRVSRQVEVEARG